MTIQLTPEQERLIDLAVQSGAYHDSKEVISTALAMLAEDIEDGAVSEARSGELRFTLDEVEAELRSIGKGPAGLE
jgi:Arc/MetJ-type ribon-helix-helix transcriptional regulator